MERGQPGLHATHPVDGLAQHCGARALAAGGFGAHGHAGAAGDDCGAFGGQLDKQIWVRCKVLLRRFARSRQIKGAR